MELELAGKTDLTFHRRGAGGAAACRAAEHGHDPERREF